MSEPVLKCRANRPDGSEEECNLKAGHKGAHWSDGFGMWPQDEKPQETVTELANRLESAVGDLRQRHVLQLAHAEMVKQRDEARRLAAKHQQAGLDSARELQAQLSQLRVAYNREARLRKIVESHKADQMEKVSDLRKEIEQLSGAMSVSAYQRATDKYVVYPGRNPFLTIEASQAQTLPYLGLGLAGEAGEVANVIKKIMRSGESFVDNARDPQLREEIGDTLWYLARIAREKGWDLDEIAQENLAKLQGRKERGELKERAARCVSQSYQGRDLRCEQAKGHPGFHTDIGYSWS